jgi:kynurenine formamidase
MIFSRIAPSLILLCLLHPSTSAFELWDLYSNIFSQAKYVDLTHILTPSIPVWAGFGPSQFAPAVNPDTNEPYNLEADGFWATRYSLATDQFGTQLDPPAHWNASQAAMDELPATFAVRPLVVISIVDKVKQDFGYQMTVADVLEWEKEYGPVPEGSVVFVRSDWSKRWPDPELATLKEFPGVTLDALQFLHLSRRILFHGHEPLDTDTTPTLEGEAWLLHNGYTQAEGVANLDKVPEAGALVTIGFPRFAGGTGGYARFVAICPSDWHHGISVGEVPDSPLAPFSSPLKWEEKLGYRTRS